VRLKDAIALGHPLRGPLVVVLLFLLIVVLVVFVPDIERRVRKDQVREGVLDAVENFAAVSTNDFIGQFSHGNILHVWRELARCLSPLLLASFYLRAKSVFFAASWGGVVFLRIGLAVS